MTTTATTATAPITAGTPAWLRLKAAATALQALQAKDGSVPDAGRPRRPRPTSSTPSPSRSRRSRRGSRTTPRTSRLRRATSGAGSRRRLRRARLPRLAHGVPAAAAPRSTASATSWCSRCTRRTARPTGTSRRVLVEVDLARVHRRARGRRLLEQAVRAACGFVDFTPGYDTNSAVLFPETVAMREIPTFTWGAIFQDREAARYRRVVRAASEITKLELPDGRGAPCSTTRS